MTRNVGMHAGGVLIAPGKLTDFCPLYQQPGSDSAVSQFDKNDVEEIGLVKFDFLGLATLTILEIAREFIVRRHPGQEDFAFENLLLDDAKVYQLFSEGKTEAVFQFESRGMQGLLKDAKPTRLEDLIAMNALYRPGPMDLIPTYLARKAGREEVVYPDPRVASILSETYGVMIYQEQVMQMAQILGGYSLGGADLLRRAMGKKDPKKMAEERGKFVEGCERTNGIGAQLAGQIFDKIEMFAGYGFNKSHSACYGHISYWTAYLKTNHPVEFMAALLSNEIQNTDKISVFVSECHRMGLEILPPSLNASQLRFAPEVASNGSPGVRYGLAAIKNCGEGAMAAAIAERNAHGPFASLEDFATRLDSKVVNKRILENLVKAGALDWTGETRAGMFKRLEQVVASASSSQRDKASGQVSLFGAMEFAAPAPVAAKTTASEPAAEEWSKDERLAHEKELLGFYVTGHPLDKFRSVIDSDKYKRLGLIDDLDIANARARFPFAGMVRSLDAKITKTGKPFGVLVLEDFTGSSEIMLWGETFTPARDAGLVEPGKIIKLKCAVQVDDRTGGRRLTGYELAELKPKAGNAKGPLELLLWTTRHGERDLNEIRQALAAHPGTTPVLLHFQNSAGRRATVAANESFNVKRNSALDAALERWIED